MGGSRIFDWGGSHLDEVRDAGQNVAIFALKSWPIGGGHGPVAPPLEPPMNNRFFKFQFVPLNNVTLSEIS